MTRRDIIMIATLANIGVLAILFMLAYRSQSGGEKNSLPEIAYHTIDDQAARPLAIPVALHQETNLDPIDEVDVALEELAPLAAEAQRDEDHYAYMDSEIAPALDKPAHQVQASNSEPKPSEKYVEVTVKRGDVLDRIARGNGVTSRHSWRSTIFPTTGSKLAKFSESPSYLPLSLLPQRNPLFPPRLQECLQEKSNIIP